ncbi:fimbrial protein StiH [Superficieibacter electus]|uniref:Fimbrial protein StiH n=1 Tax=Superficieibacter electus TaxID=2022662 RepID=A0A2P5GMD5_9ENTR|nr:fimbrial protein [Superficieibacter electus]POP42000.1 fimbrial protein StiH [Superficieibacter electus]POP47000.1 fimbrial protein StiH [Superficieibacter electus]
MKKYIILALGLFSGHALAESIGNGTGWCEATTGSHNFNFSFNQTIEDTSENRRGNIIEESWSAGGSYTAKCDCDNTDYRGYNYFTATTGSLTQKGTFSEQRYYGHMDYYVLIPGKLEIGTEAYISGHVKQYVPVPFSSLSNGDPNAGGCTGAEMADMSAGNKGHVRIYITHPLVGRITIPTTTIMNLYLSKVPVSSGDNIPPAVPPLAHVTMSGTITVPQSCSINAGQIIDVRLPDIIGKDIRNLGDSPQESHVTTQVNFTCSNVADGTNLSMSLNGENDPNNNEYLKTTNPDLGIRISDKNNTTIVPNGDAELPINNYHDGAGTTQFTAAPVNTTGHIPHTGEYQATATLEMQIR